MITKLTNSFYTNFKNELNRRINNTELLIQFFTGTPPNRDEINTFLNGDRISDKLGEVSLTLVNGEFDITAADTEEIPFTPDVTGVCTWCTVAPSDSLNEIVLITKVFDHIILKDYNIDSTVENALQKILIKI